MEVLATLIIVVMTIGIASLIAFVILNPDRFRRYDVNHVNNNDLFDNDPYGWDDTSFDEIDGLTPGALNSDD